VASKKNIQPVGASIVKELLLLGYSWKLGMAGYLAISY
jgi:hypothetical protein